MIRKGKVGAAAEDGVTPEISAAMASIGRGILQDEQILTWCYQGGPLPD
jgi:hypothetical protein